MSMVLAAGASRPARASGRARIAGPLAMVAVAALFALCHPYGGLRGDATIYAMRALADLDPAGLGRDPMVVLDGQMHYSLFPLLLRTLVGALGAAKAAMLVAALGSAAWFAALAALAHRLAPARIAWAMVAMVAVLPAKYGDHGSVFAFAETSATPRTLAEAAVLAGLAALLAERWLLVAASLIVATLIHPIMAEAGIGVAALVLAWRLPLRGRLLLLAGVAILLAAAVAAGRAGVPLLDRLVATPDRAWLYLLRARSPYLFVSLWSSGPLSPVLALAGTIVVAAHRMPALQRRLLIATLAVCASGLAIAAVFGDRLDVLLVLQAQTWRAVWLVGALGGCALAFCTATLWAEGPRGRLVLAALLLAWFFQPTPTLTLAAVALALILEFGTLARRLPFAPWHAGVALGLVALAAIDWASGPALGWIDYLRQLDVGETPSLLDPLLNNIQSLPLYTLIAAWLVAPDDATEHPLVTPVMAAACVILLALVVRSWDQRDAARVYLESPQAPAGLAALGKGRNDEVLWLDDEVDAWFTLGRPQYFSVEQAVSIVFSPALARQWVARADVLVGLGLAPKATFTPWKPMADDDRMRITQVAIDTFCARPDAPGLVIVPRDGRVPALRDIVVWRLPSPLYRVEPRVSGPERHRIEGFGIVPCAPPLPR